MVNTIKKMMIKHYRMIFSIYLIIVILSFIFSLGYATEYANPYLKINPDGAKFFEDGQVVADVIFWLGVISAVLFAVVYNAKVKEKITKFAFIARLSLLGSTFLYIIVGFIFNLQLHASFLTNVAPWAKDELFATLSAPTQMTFYLFYIFAVAGLIITTIALLSTITCYKNEQVETKEEE